MPHRCLPTLESVAFRILNCKSSRGLRRVLERLPDDRRADLTALLLPNRFITLAKVAEAIATLNDQPPQRRPRPR